MVDYTTSSDEWIPIETLRETYQWGHIQRYGLTVEDERMIHIRSSDAEHVRKILQKSTDTARLLHGVMSHFEWRTNHSHPQTKGARGQNDRSPTTFI